MRIFKTFWKKLKSSLRREPKYKNVYLFHGKEGLIFKAERRNTKITYELKEYEETSISPLLRLFKKNWGDPMTTKNIAPMLTIEIPNETKIEILWDRNQKTTLVIRTDKHCQIKEFFKSRGQLYSNTPSTDKQISKAIVEYQRIFRKQEKLLDLRKRLKQR